MKPGYVLPAADLPVGTVITAGPTRLSTGGPTVLTRVDRPGRCPWRVGPATSVRFAANWRAQELINTGARVTGPAGR